MSLLAAALRPHWVPGINEVAGRQQLGLGAWLARGGYPILVPPDANGFEVLIAEPEPVRRAYACESTRFASAAFESLEGIGPSPTLPKSCGWLAIRSYYAAFFAAHSIMRVLGRGCTQLESTHCTAINDIVTLYGHRDTPPVSAGLYATHLDVVGKALRFKRVDGAGSHVGTWRVFNSLVTDLITGVLSGPLVALDAQAASAKLIALQHSLTDDGGYLAGSWLSVLRNRINYRLELGTWYPYGERRSYYEHLFAVVGNWRGDPMTAQIWSGRGREVQRLVEAAAFLGALCRVLALDVDARCVRGRSFHHFGCLSLLRQLGV